MKQRAIILSAVAGLCGAAAVAETSAFRDRQIDNRCRTFAVALANNAVSLHGSVDALRSVYTFDVSKADGKELVHILRPPLGSRETFHISATLEEHVLTYATGRVGDLTMLAREVRGMCLREVDDGFHLRSVRVLGNGINFWIGPDRAEVPLGRSGSVVVTPDA